jgi:hypothetical protein
MGLSNKSDMRTIQKKRSTKNSLHHKHAGGAHGLPRVLRAK